MSQSGIKKYPYTTIDEDGETKIVVMTTDQADLINKKYKDMEAELNALKTTIKTQQDTIIKQRVIIKIQTDTILKQEVVIKTQIDTITRYNEKVVYIKTDKDSINTQFSSLQDSLWKWALGPTLIYTTYPDNTNVYLMDLSHYYMATDDFGIMMAKMLPKDYKKYRDFVTAYGLDEKAVWRFRNEMNIEYLPHLKVEEKKVWKYKTQYRK
jgi:hypothetical protein